MVSALRERAARQTAAEPAEESAAVVAPHAVLIDDDEVEFTTPLRPEPRRVRRGSKRLRWPRWLDGRRFGLGVSIAGAMLASAIGGGLAVAWPKLMSAGAAPEAHPAARLATAANRASGTVAHATHSAHDAPAADVPASAAHTMAKAAESAASSSAHTAESTQSEQSAASAPASLPAATAAALAAAPVAPVADLTFGLDLNGDGIPDSLERFVRKTINAPATRVAARHYYRLALPLATRAQEGEVLPHAEQQALFRATECYWLSAAEDGIGEPPNLNDRASLIGRAAAGRMQALAVALQGFDYRVGSGKRQVCG